MSGLHGLIREYSDALEASLQATYGVDLRDMWRRGSDGLPLLTMRRLGVLVRHLPSTSPVMSATGSGGWSNTDLLLSDLMAVWSENHHPSDPRMQRHESKAQKHANKAALSAAKALSESRRARSGIKGSVLRRRPPK